jgi:hypothetical protein
MSTVKKLFLLLILISAGCTQKKDMSVHGMTPSPKSQYSYMGPAERILKLNFDVSKSRFKKSAVIKAIVSLPFNYNHPLQYKWKLGENVILKSGDLTGSVALLTQNEPLVFTIEVDNFESSQNRFLRFEIVGTDPNKRIFTDGLVSSHQENSFESIVQEVEKINAKK